MATIIYCENNDDHIPYSGRDWPWMGSLDFPKLLIPEDLDPRKLHCPGDKEKPGSIASWWQQIAGGLQDSDHLDGEPPAGVQTEPDYSYYWWAKMWLDYAANNGDIQIGALRSWKLSSVKYPSLLIPYTCFTANWHPDKPTTHGRLGPVLYYTSSNLGVREGDGHQSGFLDGHCAWVPITDIVEEGSASSFLQGWPYNLDWTKNGIQGFDTY